MLWPRPSTFPSAETRAAPIGTPPSSSPFLASAKAALKPISLSMLESDGRWKNEGTARQMPSGTMTIFFKKSRIGRRANR